MRIHHQFPLGAGDLVDTEVERLGDDDFMDRPFVVVAGLLTFRTPHHEVAGRNEPKCHGACAGYFDGDVVVR